MQVRKQVCDLGSGEAENPRKHTVWYLMKFYPPSASRTFPIKKTSLHCGKKVGEVQINRRTLNGLGFLLVDN